MEQKLFELIIQIRKKCITTEEKIRKEFHLSPAEFNGLLSIHPGEKIQCASYARQMGLSASRGSRVIGKLHDNDFIQLVTVPNNRRSVEVSLTKKGVQMRKILEKQMSECENRFTSQLSEKQIKDIKKSLTLLAEVM